MIKSDVTVGCFKCSTLLHRGDVVVRCEWPARRIDRNGKAYDTLYVRYLCTECERMK